MKTEAFGRDIEASPWGWIALGAVGVSIVGYVVQSIFDYVPAPAVVGRLAFYGLFAGPAVVALVAGGIAVVTGWKRHNHSVPFGFVGLAYFVLAQTIQSLWDVVRGHTDFAAIVTFVVAALTAVTGVVLVRSTRRPL
jgi:hypothetical protein